MRTVELIARLGGRLVGEDVDVRQVAPLSLAEADQISFLSNPKYRRELSDTHAGVVILAPELEDAFPGSRIVTDNPYLYFARVSQLLNPLPPVRSGVHSSAVVEPGALIEDGAEIGALSYVGAGARIGANAVIAPRCYVGPNAEVGEDTRLMAGVVLQHGCVIGRRGLVHSGAVIGADGFGIANDKGVWVKIPQIGRVVIGDDVEIGANTTVDRGAMADTVIEDGVKLDNQIQIGHNVRVGAHTAMAGCVGVAGSAVIGRHCTVGGGAIVLGHLELADHVHVSAGTLITKSIREAGTYTGVYPFAKHDDWQKNAAMLRSLDQTLRRRVEALLRAQPEGKE